MLYLYILSQEEHPIISMWFLEYTHMSCYAYTSLTKASQKYRRCALQIIAGYIPLRKRVACLTFLVWLKDASVLCETLFMQIAREFHVLHY